MSNEQKGPYFKCRFLFGTSDIASDKRACEVVIFADQQLMLRLFRDTLLKHFTRERKQLTTWCKKVFATCIFTACQRSCGKVMFSVACVCLSVHRDRGSHVTITNEDLNGSQWISIYRYPPTRHASPYPLSTWDLTVYLLVATV